MVGAQPLDSLKAAKLLEPEPMKAVIVNAALEIAGPGANERPQTAENTFIELCMLRGCTLLFLVISATSNMRPGMHTES